MYNLEVNGIYMIENKINGMKYVGANYCENLIVGRIKTHLTNLEKGKHNCTYMQLEYNKYGRDNFRVKVIEEIDSDDFLIEEEFIEKIKNREQYYLNYYHETLLYNTDYISRLNKSKKEKFSLSRAEKMCLKASIKLMLENEKLGDEKKITPPLKIERIEEKFGRRIRFSNLNKKHKLLIEKEKYFIIHTKTKKEFCNQYRIGYNGKTTYYLFSVIHFAKGYSSQARKYALVELDNLKMKLKNSKELKAELEA